MNLFVDKTTKHKIRYKSPVAAKLQPLDEFGRARKIKQAGYYDLGFPIRDAGGALGETRITLVKMTVKEVNDRIAMMLDADKRWLRDQILAALFDNVGYTFSDDEFGDLDIKGLANGDAVKYLIRAGAEDGETANHYRTITAMDDANQNFAQIFTDLTKRPENRGGEVITMIPTNLEADVMALADFIEKDDDDIAVSNTKDRLVGSLGADVPGEVIGKVNRNWIVRWDALPDSTMVSVSTGGDRPLVMREHPEPELQGFQRVSERDDDPYYEAQYIRLAGFSAFNRVGAIVTQVTGGAYTVPTGFEQPMV